MTAEPEAAHPLRAAYLAVATSAGALLRDPVVAGAWEAPSALEKFSVGGLAGHLARQIVRVPGVLAASTPVEEPIGLLDHYARSRWVGADLDDDANVSIRDASEQEAANGAAAVAARVEAAVRSLRGALPAEPADRVVHLPWGPWSLTLDDFLVTRMMEILSTVTTLR